MMKTIKKLFIILISLTNILFAQKTKEYKKKILFVVTSHDKKSNEEKTGYYLSEVSHPWKILKEAGYEIDFVSPKGGTPPVDGFDLNDSINKEFWENDIYQNKISNSLKPNDIISKDYSAIYFAGGHGAMWDLPNNKIIAEITKTIYENNGIIGAVCHGSAGLINIKLKNGKYLIDGKKINGFSNEEETIIGLTKVVPFSLEDKIKEHGGLYIKDKPWQEFVVSDQRLVTGQNPQSATIVGEKIKELLNNK